MFTYECDTSNLLTNVVFDDLTGLLESLLVVGFNQSAICIDKLVWNANKTIKHTDLKGFDDVIKYGIGIFDYILADYCISNKRLTEVEYQATSNRADHVFIPNDYSKAVSYVYFLLMTRGKLKISENENLPNFAKKWISESMSLSKIHLILGDNDVNLIEHKWIKYISIPKLGNIAKSRFKRGICSTRPVTIIGTYDWESTAPSHLQVLLQEIRDKFKTGPYWEQHPLFNPYPERSINKNIMGLILECYSKETINRMIKNKALYEGLNDNNVKYDYRVWKSGYFDFWKTPIFSDDEVPVVTNNKKDNNPIQSDQFKKFDLDMKLPRN